MATGLASSTSGLALELPVDGRGQNFVVPVNITQWELDPGDNMPRLPVSMDGSVTYPAPDGNIQLPDGAFGNESNITNYMVDASSDWFMKQSA